MWHWKGEISEISWDTRKVSFIGPSLIWAVRMIKIKIFLDPTLAALVLLRFVMGGLLCNICTKTKIMSKCLSRFILLFLKSLQKSTYLHYSSFMNQRKAYHTYKVFTFLFILGKMSFKTVSVLKNTFIISCHGKKMRNLDIFTICYLTWGYWPVSTRPKL